MKMLRKRLTYANVMSSLAVFLVLGGATALAAGLAKNSVGSKQLKKNAVTSAKIKNNAVTTAKIENGAISGAKINLASLGKVPSAASADSATNAGHAASADNATNADHATNAGNAGNAGAVGGMHLAKLSYSANSGSPKVEIFSGAGLTLYAACNAIEELEFTATTEANHSEIYESGNYHNEFKGGYDDDFNPGEVREIGEKIGDLTEDENQGQLVYATPDGKVATAEFFLDGFESFGDTVTCAIGGTVTFS
ncbi:MAG: hypothetical protein ACTHNY_07255 [Solirubrobacterales bacterium]